MSDPYFIITAHFAVRLRQRGYRVAHFTLVENVGTLVADGIFVRKRDVQPRIEILAAQLRHRSGKQSNPTENARQKCALVQQIERLRRLSGTFVPTEDGPIDLSTLQSTPKALSCAADGCAVSHGGIAMSKLDENRKP